MRHLKNDQIHYEVKRRRIRYKERSRVCVSTKTRASQEITFLTSFSSMDVRLKFIAAMGLIKSWQLLGTLLAPLRVRTAFVASH